MKEYTVLLEDGTTGTVHGRIRVGDKVVVSLSDENGMNIFIEDIVKEILEEKDWN